MEVHAHTHTERKKWTHYFWEFLMLFLAVTLGFFVENQREHYVENQRERQFMRSLLHDLEADTSNFTYTIETHTESNKMIDTLIDLLKNPDRRKLTGKIYFFAKSIPLADFGLHTLNKTYEQMKSSGNLRLVQNISLLDSLGYYYFYFNDIYGIGPPQMQFENRHDLFVSYNKLFDAAVFQRMIRSSDEMVSMPDDNPPLLSDDSAIINEVCMRYNNMYFTRKVINGWAEDERNFATMLIKKIKKEYHLK
jgi:hypothetical protein